MPSLIVTTAEVRQNLAEKHGLMQSEIKITHQNGKEITESSCFDTPETNYEMRVANVKREFQILLNETAHATRYGNSRFANMIAVIKAVRTLTGFGLKDAKDLVEASIIPRN